MSRQLALLSRRALLRLASLSPLALLGFGSQSRGEPDCIKPASCGNIPIGNPKWDNVRKNLWAKFLQGTTGHGIKTGEVYMKAIDMAGPFVMCNFMKFPDPDGVDPETDKCCIRCGEWAVYYADQHPWYEFHTKIDADDFELAYCRTKEEMQNNLSRVPSRREDSAEGPPSPPSYARAGLGCG